MRFNEKEIAAIANRQGQMEGKLQHRAPPGPFREAGFRERFCKIVGNFLFIFRITDLGTVATKEPVGLIVLENYFVSTESDSSISFAFAITFRDETDKKHIFSARTDMDVERWVRILRESSYQYWKDKLQTLSARLSSLTAQISKSNTSRVISSQRVLLENPRKTDIKSIRKEHESVTTAASKTSSKDGAEQQDLIVF